MSEVTAELIVREKRDRDGAVRLGRDGVDSLAKTHVDGMRHWKVRTELELERAALGSGCLDPQSAGHAGSRRSSQRGFQESPSVELHHVRFLPLGLLWRVRDPDRRSQFRFDRFAY